MSKTVRLLLLELRLMTFDDSDTRVCYALIHMIQEYSTRTSEGEKIIISFTHEQIGELTGLSRVSVSNILSRFIKEGVLQKRQGHYYVKNPAIIYEKICPKTGKL
jgi:CRP/FNR family transcriptional regulator